MISVLMHISFLITKATEERAISPKAHACYVRTTTTTTEVSPYDHYRGFLKQQKSKLQLQNNNLIIFCFCCCCMKRAEINFGPSSL